MEQKKRNVLIQLVLYSFLYTILVFNFCHTERSLEQSSNCAACHFQKSSLSLFSAVIVYIPQLALAEILQLRNDILAQPILSIKLVSRSPPFS